MRNRMLALDYVRRAESRLRSLDVLYEDGNWPDVVRESQEVVELALKGLLRAVGIDPPRVRDVGDVLTAERDRLPAALGSDDVALLAAASRDLRRDRELAFYGTEDVTPSEFYREADAAGAREAARRAVRLVRPHVRAEP